MSTTCTVTFTARGPDGAILPNARLIFVPVGADVRGVGAWVVPRDRVEATADSAGQGSVALVGGSWTVTMISTLGQMTAPFDCPASGAATLESLIGQNIAAAFNAIQLSVLAAGGRGLFESPAAGRAATVNGEVFLAPLSPNGVGIYRRDSASVSPQIGTYFTGEVTTSSTDTTAGRLLKVGDFGLGGVAVPAVAGISLDDPALPNGIYRFAPGVSAGTSPTIDGFWLQLRRESGVRAHQLFFTQTQAAMHVRAWNGTAWTPWNAIVTRQSMIGTVSQTGGVPTGAVIETATNANGTFTRYADGTQECWRTLTAATGAGVAWTFPAAFVAAPVVGGTAVATVQSVVMLDAAPSATAATLSARGTNDARRADVMHLRATGRWF
jgi:hypothetical protein